MYGGFLKYYYYVISTLSQSFIGGIGVEVEETKNVSQWVHVDALLTWILIYSYDVNWRMPYSGRLGSADGLCNRRARTRVRTHFVLDESAGSLVCQYQLESLTHPCCGCIFALSPSGKV